LSFSQKPFRPVSAPSSGQALRPEPAHDVIGLPALVDYATAVIEIRWWLIAGSLF